MDVVVIGAGVLGVTTAWYLRRDGHTVTVVDRAEGAGRETSFANGALLHASHAEPWNAPGVVWQLLRWLGREDSPLLLRPGQIPRVAGWGLAFLRNSTQARFARHTRINAALAVYSLQQLRALRAETGIRYDEAANGILKVFHDRAALDTVQAASQIMAPLGVRHEVLDRAATVAREPSLQETAEHLVGGIYYPDDESGDAQRFTERLAALAADRGVVFRYGTSVERLGVQGGRIDSVETDQGGLEPDAVVLAAGNDSRALARQAGLRLPIYPVKGYSVTLPAEGWAAAPAVPIIDDARKIVLTRIGDRIRIAGMAEFAGHDTTLHPRRAEAVLRQACSLYPSLTEHARGVTPDYWTGLRPMTPDGPPILGASAVSNLYLNTGPGHMGWTFACGCARLVADEVSGHPPAIALDGLGPRRMW
ncbi:D-amino acid dehydrogenase [Aquisalimonas lutea]|uniref:D-amino acid dehydrogenase n=1 Tax=Aquisalimonas lutea TaxID=1327750 RepID=UPI0025B3AB1B|nr:D-amino acid dehydrogenase [Aquisalimonas lutea]MDN3519149.1 D-amino acid dehydrogenase [Aquisalimonas lutea]